LIQLNNLICREVGTTYALSKSSESHVYQEKIMTATLHTAGHLNTMGLPVVSFTHIEEAAASAARAIRNVALFAVAPFIGLVYALAMPLVGLGMLVWIGASAIAHSAATRTALTSVRNVALFVASPLIGLVYALARPLVGIVLIAQTAYQAYRVRVLVE
jgi:hypothetical protein